MSEKIDHRGIIEQIDGKLIKVRIVQSSACSSCHVKNICSSSENKEKIIDVYTSDCSAYSIGEHVNVCASESMGRDAIILAFVIPLTIIFIWIFVSVTMLSFNELTSVSVVILLLSIYYYCLYKNKKRIGKNFAFWIEKK